MNTCKIVFRNSLINQFHATGLFGYPPENIRKPKVFWCFHGVPKETSGMKWVKVYLEELTFITYNDLWSF